MEFRHLPVKRFEIKRRTFEGKTNPAKNNNSLTSKYMPSYKYWLLLDFGCHTTEDCYPTKRQCYQRIEEAKREAGKLL